MGNVSDKSCRENQNTYFRFNNAFFYNRAVYVIRKNVAVPRRSQMTIWRMRVPWWIPTATNTHSE